jgi:hypothetical protein
MERMVKNAVTLCHAMFLSTVPCLTPFFLITMPHVSYGDQHCRLHTVAHLGSSIILSSATQFLNTLNHILVHCS